MCDFIWNLQVLLLCGPPGLGKTTLAHVAAKHCGYRVVEVYPLPFCLQRSQKIMISFFLSQSKAI